MNISKYLDFYLEEKISKKTNLPYYCISFKVADTSIPLVFLTKDKYDLLIKSLSE